MDTENQTSLLCVIRHNVSIVYSPVLLQNTLHSRFWYTSICNISLLSRRRKKKKKQTTTCQVVILFSSIAPGFSDVCTVVTGCQVSLSWLALCRCFDTIRLLLTQEQQSVSFAFEKTMTGGQSVVDLWRLVTTLRFMSQQRGGTHTQTHTRPSASKFITVHHFPTCSVMTFSQSHKNPGKPVGVNQCRATSPAAAHIHY